MEHFLFQEKRSSDWTDRGGGGGGEGRSGGGENNRGGVETRTEVRSLDENNGLSSRPNPAKIHCDRSLRGSQVEL